MCCMSSRSSADTLSAKSVSHGRTAHSMGTQLLLWPQQTLTKVRTRKITGGQRRREKNIKVTEDVESMGRQEMKGSEGQAGGWGLGPPVET